MILRNRSVRKQAGASMVEYALLVSLISLVSLAGVNRTGITVRCKVYTVEAAVRGGLPVPTSVSGCPRTRNGGPRIRPTRTWAGSPADRDTRSDPRGGPSSTTLDDDR